MRNKKKYHIIIWGLAIIAVLIAPRICEKSKANEIWELVRVVDGDTLLVAQGDREVSLRLIGVDAPESVHPDTERNNVYGQQSAAYLEDIVTGVSSVYLETDEELYDTYGRMLAYVYLEEGADFTESINYRLVADGYALAKSYPPNVRYEKELEAGCARAKEAGMGLWKTTEDQ